MHRTYALSNNNDYYTKDQHNSTILHRGLTLGWVWLCEVDECVSIVIVSLHVAVLNEPLDLLLDHLLRRNEHVLENLNQFRLKGSVGKTLPHLHDLDYGLLREEWEKRRS